MTVRIFYMLMGNIGATMKSEIMEDMRNEAAQKAELKSARETARRMIKDGELSLEKIARYVPSLSMDELKELEAEVMQLA